jgi:hypothetical protein
MCGFAHIGSGNNASEIRIQSTSLSVLNGSVLTEFQKKHKVSAVADASKDIDEAAV